MKLALSKIIAEIEANIARCKKLDESWFTWRNRRFSRLQIAVEESLVEKLKSYQEIIDEVAKNKAIQEALTLAKEQMKNVDHHINDYAYPMYSPYGLHGIDVSQMSDHYNVETRLKKGIGTYSYRLIFDLEKRIKAAIAGVKTVEVKTAQDDDLATENTGLLQSQNLQIQYRSF
ncbi:MAG: hypothetical protein V4501_10865 [Pseudomonadota bacterium]